MRVGYAKMGRSMYLDPDDWNPTGGDSEPRSILRLLAQRNPDVEFRIVTRSKGDPAAYGLPGNVTTPLADVDLPLIGGATARPLQELLDHANLLHERSRFAFEGLDHVIVWSGPHGSISFPIPSVRDRDKLAKPHMQYVNYGAMLTMGLNVWRDGDPANREETWLCTDPRHYVRARDLKWPTVRPILSQYDWSRKQKNERFEDPRSPQDFGWEGKHENGVWVSPQRYVYSGLEMACLLDPGFADYTFTDDETGRRAFGLFINETKPNVSYPRAKALEEWVLPLRDGPGIAFLHGRWSQKTRDRLGIEPTSVPWPDYFPTLQSARCTFTTPPSGEGWATTKPWEAFAAGTVCFFHPRYDTQGHIIPTLRELERGEVPDGELRTLAMWLRPPEPESLYKRVELLSYDTDTWRWLVQAQRRLFDRACEEQRPIRMMEERFRT